MADAPGITNHEFIRNFESLGGAGRGGEFGAFLAGHGVQALGLLGRADLTTQLLILALEERFAGVGEADRTVIFRHGNDAEWWTRDSRYWMAMRSPTKVESADPNDAAPEILGRLRTQRDALVADLEAGRKLFVFRDSVNDVDDAQAERLHAAIRAYGPGSLFLLRYETAGHPSGSVEAIKPGLLIGYVAHFTFSRENRYIGPIDDVLLNLCRQAWSLHSAGTEPKALTRESASVAASRRSRHIAFVGNVQIEAMASLYRRHVAPRTRDRVDYISTQLALGEECRAAIEQADLVVEQVIDVSPQAETGALAPGKPRIQVPLVTGAFLWPFRAQAHPRAKSYPFMPGGAFDPDTSDSFLNRLILGGTDPEEAVEIYVNLNVMETVNLDRLYELMIDRQRRRDAATGYDIAGIIETRFRSEYLFLTPYHPNVRVSLALADELFRRLGAESDDIDRMHAQTLVSPFPVGETPIHPAVCKHWNLQYIAPDQRYRYRNEGAFTFREYALRYMRYEWNQELEEGLWLSRQQRFAEAIAPLRAGVAASPQSAAGFQALGEALMRSGEAEAAFINLRRALAIEPSNAGHHAALGDALQQAGRLDEAEAALREAAAADPSEPEHQIKLAHTLRSEGKIAEAADAYERALALNPWAEQIWRELAVAKAELQDRAGAEQAMRRALEIDGSDPELHAQLARLSNQGSDATGTSRPASNAHSAQAVPAPAADASSARGAAAPAPNTGPIAGGSSAHASEASSANGAAAPAPNTGPIADGSSAPASDAGSASGAAARAPRASPTAEAPAPAPNATPATGAPPQPASPLTEAFAAAVMAPEDAGAYSRVGVLLRDAGDMVAAEQAFRRAIHAAPDSAHYRHQLSTVFLVTERQEEAIALAEQAIEREPVNPNRYGYLADLLGKARSFARARAALEAALALMPSHLPFRINLSDMFAREGRLAEALDTAQAIVRDSPAHPSGLAHLARVEQMLGQLREAEAHLRAALALDPDSAPLRQQLDELLQQPQPA